MKERFAIIFRKAAVIGFLISFVFGCAQISRNEIEGVFFSYETYIQELESETPEYFIKDNYKRVDNSDLGFFRGKIWTEVKLTNLGEMEKSVVIGSQDKLNHNYSLYQKDTITNKLTLISGPNGSNIRDGRTYQFSEPNFRVDIGPGATEYYYLHSSSDGRIATVAPFATSLDDYMSVMSRETYINGFFYGSLFIIFIINLFFWRSFKNKIHGFYSFYILFTLFLYIGFEGYLYNKGIDRHHIDHIIFLALRGLLTCLIFFTASFLRIDELTPKFYKWLKRGIIIVTVGMTCYQFIFFDSSIGYLHQIENAISFFWMIMVLSMVVFSIRQKRREVKYYLVALFFYLFFILWGALIPYIDFLYEIGLPANFLYKLGTALEVIIFTYTTVAVMGLKEKEQKKENEEIKITRENIESENKELKNQIKNSNMQKMEFLSILKLIESNLNNEQEWTIFKDKVNEVNPTFLKNLQGAHQNLSKTDLRLLLLVKLGFTQKEIAGMLFIAEGSVKKSKQRVRKKLGLSVEVTLSEYLSNF